jgi:hypothetical protein
LRELTADASDPVVAQVQRVQPGEGRESFELDDLVVAEIDGVELVLRRAHVLDRRDLVTCAGVKRGMGRRRAVRVMSCRGSRGFNGGADGGRWPRG